MDFSRLHTQKSHSNFHTNQQLTDPNSPEILAKEMIKRDLPGSPRHAFRFWSELAMKRKWTSCHPDWAVLEDSFDFRPGGAFHTYMTGPLPDGTQGTSDNPGCFLEIVRHERIVGTSMLVGGWAWITARMSGRSMPIPKALVATTRSTSRAAKRALTRVLPRVDPEYGGFGRAPKFPNTMTHDLLLIGAAFDVGGLGEDRKSVV